jgi:hypothetical protein
MREGHRSSLARAAASQNFLFDINIGKSVVVRRRVNTSRQIIDCISEHELGRPITVQGGGAYARCLDDKTALPAEAHIPDSQATRKETVAHSTKAAECAFNTGMYQVLFHVCSSLTW